MDDKKKERIYEFYIFFCNFKAILASVFRECMFAWPKQQIIKKFSAKIENFIKFFPGNFYI